MVLIVAFAVGLLVYFITQQMNRRKGQQTNRMELKRRESLDAILKNNKDRYTGE